MAEKRVILNSLQGYEVTLDERSLTIRDNGAEYVELSLADAKELLAFLFANKEMLDREKQS